VIGTRPFDERVVVVTGASGGIGRATAVRLAERGARVVACARDTSRLRRLAIEVPGIEVRRCDVRSPAERAAFVDGVLARHGRVDALVNNAGVGWEGLVEDMDYADVERLVTTNVTALIDLTRLVLPSMIEARSGDIVLVSSVSGFVSLPPQTVYCATKYAVEGFAEGLRREVWRRGVRVHTVNPAPVRTEWLARSRGWEPPAGSPEANLSAGVPVAWVAAAVERCLSRPWPRSAAVPRILGLARMLTLPPLRQVVDAVAGYTSVAMAGARPSGEIERTFESLPESSPQ
jgi:NAD(P)-dependent dehydrogenase (short-subunit alcohol dehydrogenase family)